MSVPNILKKKKKKEKTFHMLIYKSVTVDDEKKCKFKVNGCGDTESVATNRKELHAEFSIILLISLALCKLKHYE